MASASFSPASQWETDVGLQQGLHELPFFDYFHSIPSSSNVIIIVGVDIGILATENESIQLKVRGVCINLGS